LNSKVNNSKDFIIVGTAPNQAQKIRLGSKEYKIIDLVKLLKDKEVTIIGLNMTLQEQDFRDTFTNFMSIDYYMSSAYATYPDILHKAILDKTIKKRGDELGYVLDRAHIFSVCSQINNTTDDTKLFLDKFNPTVLQTALNYCLVKGIQENCTKENINVYLVGIELDEYWEHVNPEKYKATHSRKSKESI
jgi:hypothetical protein